MTLKVSHDRTFMQIFLTLTLALTGGFAIFWFARILGFVFNSYGTSPVVSVLILCLILPLFCWVVSRKKSEGGLAIGLAASATYIVFTSLAFVGMVAENNQHDGVFWYADYSPISFLLYLSVPILSILAAYLSAERVPAGVWLWVAAFFIFFLLDFYSVMSTDNSIRESSVSIDFFETPKLALSAYASCTYTNYQLYWLFRRVESGNCECYRIVVTRRSPDLFLPRKARWSIDGIEEVVDISPNSGGGIVLDKYGQVDKKRSDWSNWKDWNTRVPYKKITEATDVTFTWGDTVSRLNDSQRMGFMKIAASYDALK